MLQTVRVRLRKPQRVLVFLARDITLERGDACIVRTDWGLEYGVSITEPEDCGGEAAKRYTMPVVRKATPADHETLTALAAEEKEVATLCMQRIRDRNLPMQVVDAEYTFDRHKVVVNFTADDRVDFRELVRDLSQDLKARIELRHIQVRDKSKIVGGLAGCGRELCCATWLSAFMPISMKMAKRQNLSLNPTKISGQCGRLMCCLSYENDMYETPRKKKCQGCSVEDVAVEASPDVDAEGVMSATTEEMPARNQPRSNPKPAPRPAQKPTPKPLQKPQPSAVAPPSIPEVEEEEFEDDVDVVEDTENVVSIEGTAPDGESGQKRKRSRRRRRRRRGTGSQGDAAPPSTNTEA